MDINKYLERIDYEGDIRIDTETLMKLTENHVFHVPFENLDIHFKRIFNLDLDKVYDKVVNHNRGGFCYEVNFLFYELLKNLGFKCHLISAKIMHLSGNFGPDFDHLAIIIETEKSYLADVAYGDLLIRPLEMTTGIQSDGRNQFKIEKYNQNEYSLSMLANEVDFEIKYLFNLNPVKIEDFYDNCLDKQINPNSYFVQNTICTKPTESGRITIFNDKFIEKNGSSKYEKLINNDQELKHELKVHFGIELSKT